MTARYNPPPNWPQPPAGWVPPARWVPDPRWGPPPAGWPLWVEDVAPKPVHQPTPPPVRRSRLPRGGKGRIFLSYRRSDCQSQANGLYDGLSHRLPAAKIFMDLDSIPPGADFEAQIREEIEDCDLVLVLIGDNWLDYEADGSGRRIDRRDDFVRLEIESALASPEVRVVPVLVEGARMPAPSDLPPSIRDLTRFNAFELDDRRWTADLGRLADAIPTLLNQARAAGRTSATTPTVRGPVAAAPLVSWQSGGQPAARTPVAGWVMIFLPILTLGLAAFVPALWAASQRRGDRTYRRRMYIFAGFVGVIIYAGFIVTGSTSSPFSDVALGLVLISMVTATVVAAVNRNPRRGLEWQ